MIEPQAAALLAVISDAVGGLYGFLCGCSPTMRQAAARFGGFG
jgi:hypothetical protein